MPRAGLQNPRQRAVRDLLDPFPGRRTCLASLPYLPLGERQECPGSRGGEHAVFAGGLTGWACRLSPPRAGA
jgi:hypothetical protein